MQGYDEHIVKAELLRAEAALIRDRVAAGAEPVSDLVHAHLLEERAGRIETGEPDHSRVELTHLTEAPDSAA